MSVEPIVSNSTSDRAMRREHDSVDDFEHLEHERPQERLESSSSKEETSFAEPSRLVSWEMEDAKKASVLLVESERGERKEETVRATPEADQSEKPVEVHATESKDDEEVAREDEKPEEISEIRASVLPAPEKSPTLDFLADTTSKKNTVEDSWNVVEKAEEQKPQTPFEGEKKPLPSDKFEMSIDFVLAETPKKGQTSGAETGESEFESEVEASPAKSLKRQIEKKIEGYRATEKIEEIEIAPKEIFKSMGIDAWFNPERLNPKVAALIYWRDPKKTGIVFGAILGVLLSLAYFSLISVLAYLSLIILTGTVAFRIYKTVLQAVQKTSDGHPFKDILDLDLTLPAEKVHEVADVAIAYANAAISELRSLFLVEDFVDSVKFGVLLWCLTYIGPWFNGMTLIIIGVVALFTLPKVYETNKAQIDQNLALMQGRINELTVKVKAAIPLGKKAEPAKEE